MDDSKTSPKRIEELYTDLRDAGGQTAQHKLGAAADAVASGFAETVAALGSLPSGGRFYPERKKSLRDLAEREPLPGKGLLYDTEELQAWLGIPSWRVIGAPELDFRYVDRELVASRIETDGKGQLAAQKVRLDLLLINANRNDRTPIIGEVKIAGDENALLALVQALAAAAQLSPQSQRQRFVDVYPEHFGKHIPSRLDVYVLMHEPPLAGIRPKLFKMALALAAELQERPQMGLWLRRIAFLETVLAADDLRFQLAGPVSEFKEPGGSS